LRDQPAPAAQKCCAVCMVNRLSIGGPQ
jgi:hypothetical protein